MIFSALLLLLQQAQSEAPTLEEALKLPPVEAGNLILPNNAYGRIVSVEEVKNQLQPPNFVQLHLLEEPVRSNAGCSRTRWTATFQTQPGRPLSEAEARNIFDTTEIKLAATDRCGSDSYVSLHPKMEKDAGFAALAWLERLHRETSDKRFVCSDETQSGLCKDVGSIQRELAALRPWAVSLRKDHFELWLGIPGQVVTAVRFRPERPELVEIERRIPAPF